MKRAPITIFTTGGTIDKVYFDAKSEFQVGMPQIGELLREANVTPEFRVESLFRKDSLDMSDVDRAEIRRRVVDCTSSRILVTHGTDTMIATGLALAGIEEKTIVLTGSMQPARLRISDAVFNIGFAMAAVQLLSAGVYIAMNGQVFDPSVSVKNVAKNRFESEN
ncbi:MAG: asparaginase [Gammaproteobacteria bacterium]|nr:asparaginase [Gammaproteobacteria bacterium]